MRAKKIEKKVEEVKEIQAAEEPQQEEVKKDIKLGEIQLKESAVLVIKKTNYMGSDRVDFRVWLNSASYKGPTKQGFALPMEKVDEFVKIVEDMKKKLAEKG
jgi:hypothetical protein